MTKLVPLNDLSRISEQDLEKLTEISKQVLISGNYVSGPQLKHFEEALTFYLGVEGAVGVGNGTDALIIAMVAVGVERGDAVLTVANAGSYSTIAAKAVGAEPVFCDVDEGNLQLSVDTFSEAFAKCQAADVKPKALVITHLFGLLNPQIEELVGLAHSKGLVVIEDCAQAIGARSSVGKAGSFGDIAAFSFYPTKNLGAVGDGGAVVSRDVNVLSRTRSLREYGWSEKYHIEIGGGRNSRLDELQAAILNFKLEQIDHLNKKRREIYARYLESLSDNFESFGSFSEGFVAHLAVFSSKTSSRKDVFSAFRQRGVSTGVHYPTLDADQGLDLRYKDLVALPISRKYVKSIFTVPLFPEMTEEEVEAVAAALSREV